MTNKTGVGPGRGTRLGMEGWVVVAIAHRDLLKLWRDRPRFAVNVAFPVLLVAGLGSVLQATVGAVIGLNTVTVAFTGVFAATVFQSTAAGMISIVEDRESDFARELFVAPVRRTSLLAGKMLGESLVALSQALALAGFAAAAGVSLSFGRLARMLPVALACCLLGAAFGLCTVALLPNQRAAMQVFQFLIIPQYLLGGVLLPLHAPPGWLDAIAAAMPLRYAVDLDRAAYFAGTEGYASVADVEPLLAGLVVAVLILVLGTVGVALFSHRERNR